MRLPLSHLLLVLLSLAGVVFVIFAGCTDRTEPYGDCGPQGCNTTDADLDVDADTDIDADTDADGEADADVDVDSDSDTDADADEEPLGEECEFDLNCSVAMNYNVCCPCPDAMPSDNVDNDECILPVVREVIPPRPLGCGIGCEGAVCMPCSPPPAHHCVRGLCVSQHPGDCQLCCDQEGVPCGPDWSCCAQGSYCIETEAGNVCEERDLCDSTDPESCEEGMVCDNHLSEDPPRHFCWHPDSTCCCTGTDIYDHPAMNHTSCMMNAFCEDVEGDGVYHCEGGGTDCRAHSAFAGLDCMLEQVCDDAAVAPPDDGRGACIDP